MKLECIENVNVFKLDTGIELEIHPDEALAVSVDGGPCFDVSRKDKSLMVDGWNLEALIVSASEGVPYTEVLARKTQAQLNAT